MIIKGYLDRSFSPPAPAVRAFISIERLEVEGYIKLLIDTGASSTAILDKDRELLGIDLKKIESTPVKIGGIGGVVDTYLARNTKLSFRVEEGEHIEMVDVLVLKHDLIEVPEEVARRILAMPSLLGRDVMRKFKFIYGEREDRVALEGLSSGCSRL
jgi:hypothetical protein